MPNSGAESDVNTTVKILATIAIGILVLGPIFQMAGSLSGSQVQIHPIDNTETQLASGDIPHWVGVTATTGRGIEYTSDGGHTSFSAPLNTSESYTATTVVELSSDADLNATYTLLGYNSQEFALYYDNGTYLAYVDHDNQTATASLPAPSPRSQTLVGFHYNATSDSLQVLRETTRSPTVALSNQSDSTPVSWTLDGTQDELRLVQANLTDSQLARLSSTPAASLPGTDRIARIMWDHADEPPEAYFTGSTASVTGGEYTSGVPDPGLTRGQDYELFSNPFVVRVLDGGLIEEAPVAYVSWNGPFGTFISSIQELANTALLLLAIATLAIGGRRALKTFE